MTPERIARYQDIMQRCNLLGYNSLAAVVADGSQIPDDPELPLPLNKVHPIHEIVKIDYFLPGCPPSGDAIWAFLTQLIEGKDPALGHGLLHYD